jgi:hypothetical protein
MRRSSGISTERELDAVTTNAAETQEGNMSLSKEYVRDGNRRIIGSIITGYTGGTSTIVRDEHNEITGRTSERFNTVRDAHGNLVSINSSDPGLVIGHKK